MVDEVLRFTRVTFSRFKAFERFRLDLRHFNVLVGPNNAGKSTIIAAFRILAEAMRRAEHRKADFVLGPRGRVHGHAVDLSSAFVAEENLFFEYDDDEPAIIDFELSNANKLSLYFPEQGACYLIPDAQGKACSSPATFKKQFNCRIGFAPVLSPVDHYERPYLKEAARKALLNYQASRNFRNIWYHFPEKFLQFKSLVEETWPGMSVDPPELGSRDDIAFLFMYCPEKRRPREIFWSGFGFQIWCQMLTHLVQSSGSSIFLIDEPDVYLHSDLQRQLVAILKSLGPDIVLATHSTEIIAEADADDIVLISKERRSGRRLRSPIELGEVFSLLGSSANPILTQLAKTRRVIFVEGSDYRMISRFARKLGLTSAAIRSDFAVIPTEGFSADRIRSLQAGMEHPLGRKVLSGAVLDRDFRSEEECARIERELSAQCAFVRIHRRKEIENFALVPEAIDRLVRTRFRERHGRDAEPGVIDTRSILMEFADSKKHYVMSQYTDSYKRFRRASDPKVHETQIVEQSLRQFEERWSLAEERLKMIPGKDAFSFLNGKLQDQFKIAVTPLAVVDAMRVLEVPNSMRDLIEAIASFAHQGPPG